MANQAVWQLGKMRVHDFLLPTQTIPKRTEAAPERMGEGSDILANLGAQIAPNTRASSLLHHV